MRILVSCEAGGERIPVWLLAEAEAQELGGSEDAAPRPRNDVEGRLSGAGTAGRIRGDAAAVHAARRLSRRWNAPLLEHEYSLGVVDVTKSLHHRQLFPPSARSWRAGVKRRLIDEIYRPYRAKLRQHLAPGLVRGAMRIHVSVRSFPARQQGRMRRADVGLLYDPSRGDELDLCLDWIDEMYEELPMLRVRRNYPRRGTTDSITKALRAEFAGERYLGIELWLNRAWAARSVAIREQVLDGIAASFAEVTQLSRTEAA